MTNALSRILHYITNAHIHLFRCLFVWPSRSVTHLWAISLQSPPISLPPSSAAPIPSAVALRRPPLSVRLLAVAARSHATEGPPHEDPQALPGSIEAFRRRVLSTRTLRLPLAFPRRAPSAGILTPPKIFSQQRPPPKDP